MASKYECVKLSLYTTVPHILNMRAAPLSVKSVCICVDGSDSRDKPKLYRLQHSITEVGSDCIEDGAIQVNGLHYGNTVILRLTDS